ncbi:MAG TPA: DUF4173 domain-containing protein [Ruminiclostridium sp.]
MENKNLPQSEALNQQAQVEIQTSAVQAQTQAPTVNPNAQQVSNIPRITPPYYQPYIPRHVTPAYIAFKARVITPKGLIITVLSILLCILYTETILLGSAGISVPIFAVAFYGTLFYFFRENEKALNKSAVYLTLPILLLAFSFLIHYNPSTQFITWLALIGLICIQLVLLGNAHVSGVFTFDMFAKAIVNLVGKPFSNLGMPFHSFGILKNNKSKTLKNSIYILIGLAVSLPIAAILMNLFMSADAVFSDAMNTVSDFIGLDFANVFWDIVLGLVFGLFLAATLLGLKYGHSKEKPAVTIGDNIESIIVGTFLTIINVFIIAFVAFQFVYLFGGTVNITASGMSYADYARRGFFELSTASGIIFAIALFVLIMTKKKAGKLPLWIQLATVSLCVCNGVLLVSAVKRMLLYVDAYGLSVLRVLTLWFMGIIGLCLLWMVIKCFVSKIDVMKWIGLTIIVGVCVLSLTNTERIIAKYNIERYINSPTKISLDVLQLGQLSYTTAPEIAKLAELDLKAGPITNLAIQNILKSQKEQLEYRNRLYGFTLDSIEARRILASELK